MTSLVSPTGRSALALERDFLPFDCIGHETARPGALRARVLSRLARIADRGLGRRRRSAVTVAPAVDALIGRLPTGGWSIGDDTARVLATLFEAVRPRLVLEFGSGCSTVLFAALCARAGEGARVVSLDENETFADRTRAMLREFGLAAVASIVVAPVGLRSIGDWTGEMYRPPEPAIRHALSGLHPDLVFVDGPANWLGKRGDCRFGTLPAALEWAEDGCVFVADDALRRRDLAIVRRWAELPFIEMHGIVPIGRGLAVGRLRRR